MASRLDRVQNWEHLAREYGYQIPQIAKRQHVSERQLRRYFRRRFGVTAKEWLDTLRARDATEQLVRGDLVKTVSGDLNFKQRSHFSKFVKRVLGTPPSNCGQM
jgi:AraC-like DNA-binding protein